MAAAASERYEVATTIDSFILDSSFFIINTTILEDVTNFLGIFPSCQSANIIVNIDQKKKKGSSLPATLLCTMCKWTTSYYTNSKCTSSYGYEKNWLWSCYIRKTCWVIKYTRTSITSYRKWHTQEPCWYVQ